MTAKTAERAALSIISSRILSVSALTAGLGLAGCADVESTLFGGSRTSSENTQASTSTPPPAPSAPITSSASTPTTYARATTYARDTLCSGESIAPVATITPISIERAVIRARPSANRSQRCATRFPVSRHPWLRTPKDLRIRAMPAPTRRLPIEAKAHITTRLQVGTTRAIPNWSANGI